MTVARMIEGLKGMLVTFLGRHTRTLALFFVGLGPAGDRLLGADDTSAGESGKTENQAAETAPIELNPNLTTRTLGGRQFWADVHYFHDWRIQKNVKTGHFRLLDGDDKRHAWGTFEQCKEKLREVREEQRLPPMSGEVVLLLHGIIRTGKSMRSLAGHLEKQGYHTISVEYPSTCVDIETSARYLGQALESLEGVSRVHFVVHSMGGLVVRACLATHDEPRIGRMVMIGTPNQGAHLATRFKSNIVYRYVLGPAGQQLSATTGLIPQLPTPPFEFAIIAGGRGTNEGFNPLIPGDDDGTVSVESTRLPGAADFIIVNRIHSQLCHAPETLDFATRFLKDGKFREADERHSIPLPSETTVRKDNASPIR